MICEQLREYIIRPALHDLDLYSEGAEELLVATCAHESNGGVYVAQVKGPALGIYQMEPKTFYSVWNEMHKSGGYKNVIYQCIMKGCNFNSSPKSDDLITNFKFSTMMAIALYYNRLGAEIPRFGDINHIWEIYKKAWNTNGGKATQEEFVEDYKKFTGKS